MVAGGADQHAAGAALYRGARARHPTHLPDADLAFELDRPSHRRADFRQLPDLPWRCPPRIGPRPFGMAARRQGPAHHAEAHAGRPRLRQFPAPGRTRPPVPAADAVFHRAGAPRHRHPLLDRPLPLAGLHHNRAPRPRRLPGPQHFPAHGFKRAGHPSGAQWPAGVLNDFVYYFCLLARRFN